jgi:hypothetical protein
MTNVTATAITEIVAVCRMMFSRLFELVKPWSPSVAAKNTNSTAKPT